MKYLTKASLLILIIFFFNCTITTGSLNNFTKAAIHDSCNTPINFQGNDIYGYKLTDEAPTDYWQVGAHINHDDEWPEIGINIFIEEFVDGQNFYDVTTGFEADKAQIYYFDQDGNQYVSSPNNTGIIAVGFIKGTSDTWDKLTIQFNNVEVIDPNTNVTKCINKFDYRFLITE
ncbi:hypothetical protein [Seonamhaeicola sp.]|uniref:hypothetical protein n=1 Tax=Seonamhaeicola sp. TaxID=1912245 RepID=UPI002639C01E|nr:hypothetical protein [Seonamhaeicola sp.]